MPQYALGPGPGGSNSVVQINQFKAANNLVKSTPGTIYRVSVVQAATTNATAGVYDTNVLASVSNSNLICSIPVNASLGPVELIWPCKVGITVVPGTGASVSVSYE